MNDANMREAVLKAYPSSKTWPAKVKKMDNQQLFAVYTRLKAKKII